MKRSLFTRYITVFMLIIFISFALLALVISSNNYMVTLESRSEMVDRAAKSVSTMMTEIYKPDSADELSAIMSQPTGFMLDYLNHIADISEDMRIFVFDSKGALLGCSKGENFPLLGTSLKETQLSVLMSGDVLVGHDNMGGVLKERSIYHGEPIMNNSGTTVIGSVVVCSSSRVVDALVVGTVKTIVLASLWVFLAALVAVYFMSERIIGPLKDMSRAAKSYAAGNFDIRIPVRGTDEVAELATAFNQMATGLQSFEELRRSFLANVSHDLKTPMTTISGFIDGILSGAIPPESQTEYLERIKSEVLRLSRLVRQLLDLSRIQAGDRQFEFISFDICEVARQILLSFEQRIDEKKLNVEFNCDEDRMRVIADKDAIHQILYNICDNAVKFSNDRGKLRIDIYARDKKIHVSVYNEGQGIPKEDIPFVFERFYKSDKSRGLDKSGVGLGLYISKTIIDAHGETITAESDQGKYCKFEFTLKPAENRKNHAKE